MVEMACAAYSVRNALAKDPVGTLKKVAGLGYVGIELFNHIEDRTPGLAGMGVNMTEKEYKNIMDDLGLKTVGYMPLGTSAGNYAWLESEDTQKRLIDFCLEVGSSSLSATAEFFTSKEQILRRSEVLNKLGERCNAAGIDFVYHNHWNDFILYDGETAFDILMANTDPLLFKIELCVFWTLMGMEDPAKLIRKMGPRVIQVHEKDYPLAAVSQLDVWKKYDKTKPLTVEEYKKHKQPEMFVEVGEGIIKVQEVINALNDVGARYIILEQDFTSLPTEIDSITVSAQNVKKMFGVKFNQ